MLDNNHCNQTTTLQSLSDIPGISELDDRSAASVSGGANYIMVLYDGFNGNGSIIEDRVISSKRGIDFSSKAFKAAKSVSIIGTTGNFTQYRLTTQTAVPGAKKQQYLINNNPNKFNEPINLIKGADAKTGIRGFSINQIR
jgi:hypothetical protein